MPTIIEHEIHHDDSMSSVLTAFIAIVAILIVATFALYTLRIFPFNTRLASGTMMNPAVNVNLTGPVPVTNP